MARKIEISDEAKAERMVHEYIGERLRHHRLMAGLSQENLATEILVTFQQYQKYEYGKNRLSAGKLYLLARALEVPVGMLFPQDQVKDYEPAPPRALQVMRRISRIVSLHPDEMSAISKALSSICGNGSDDE